MEEEFLMAYRLIEIKQQKFMVVFPIPSANKIKQSNFNYSEYLKNLITKLEKTTEKERIELLNKWANPNIIHSYDKTLGRIQIEYELALRKVRNEKEISDIYTNKMKQIVKEYEKEIRITPHQTKQEVELKKKYQNILITSQERFASFLEGTIPVNDLYPDDLRYMEQNQKQRAFRRYFFGTLNMGIQEELTELELRTMTLQELWNYNKNYLERKSQKEKLKKAKTKKK